MKIPLYQVDAFADVPFTGNAAAVCPLEAWPTDVTLQSIAEENNLSETAFYVPQGNDYHLRWFTPVAEVDLCGHATLAAAFALFRQHTSKDEIVFHTRSGALTVRKQGEMLTLDFPSQPGVACEAPEILVRALGVRPLACFCGADYMAVLESEEIVQKLTPDFALLRELDLRGVIVTAGGNETDFVSRCFFPKYGIDEDPVTGSSHCMMMPYWSEYTGRRTLSARQLSKRGGNLLCELRGERVMISGKAVLYLEGSISLP